MATSADMTKAKTTGFMRRFGGMSTWLPLLAAFLCLSLLAMAVIVLFDVNADPESAPGAVVTSNAAQGYQGLRRLLQARGHEAVLNRFEDDRGGLERGDVEIITLDADYSPFAMLNDGEDGSDSSSSSSSSSASAGDSSSEVASAAASSTDASQAIASASRTFDASSSAAEASSSSAASEASARAAALKKLMVNDAGLPNAEHAQHLLYHPLGRAVLVVAPKWSAGPFPQYPRWAMAPEALTPDNVRHTLAVLSPVSMRVVDTSATPPAPQNAQNSSSSTSSSAASSASVSSVASASGGTIAPDGKTTAVAWDQIDYRITQNAGEGAVSLHAVPGAPLFSGSSLDAGKITSLQSISGPNLTPILLGPKGEVLLSRLSVLGGRAQTRVPVYLLSDPDLLNNQILSSPQKTITALDLIDGVTPVSPAKGTAPARYVFNVTFNGMSFDRDLLHAVSRPPFLAVPLAMLLIGIGLAWAAFARFGPPVVEAMEAPLGRGVRILADNAARLMAMTLKETRLGPAYAQLMRDRVLKARGYMQIDPHQSPDDLAERIGRTHGTTHSFLDLKSKAERIATVHQLVDLTLQLHAWKTEIDHAHI